MYVYKHLKHIRKTKKTTQIHIYMCVNTFSTTKQTTKPKTKQRHKQ